MVLLSVSDCSCVPLTRENSNWESGNGTECHEDYPAQSMTLFFQRLAAFPLEGKMPATARVNSKKKELPRRGAWKEGQKDHVSFRIPESSCYHCNLCLGLTEHHHHWGHRDAVRALVIDRLQHRTHTSCVHPWKLSHQWMGWHGCGQSQSMQAAVSMC